MKRFRRLAGGALRALCLALLGPLAAVAGPPMVRDAELQQALLGVWCNSSDGGKTCWAWDSFAADASFAACGRTEDDQRAFFGRGVVSIEGFRMCYVVTAASDSFWLPPGQRYCTEILAIDALTHRYRDIDSGAEYTLYRRAPTEQRCPALP